MAIAFVSAANNKDSTGTATTLAVTLSPVNGNQLVVAVSLLTTTSAVTSVTDNGTSKYIFVGAQNNSTSIRCELWACTKVSGSPTSITANFAASQVDVCVSQYSGGLQFGSVTTATGSSTAPSVSETIEDPNNFAVCAIAASGVGTFSATTGNLRTSSVGTGCGGAAMDNTAASRSSVTNTAAITISNPWAVVATDLRLVPMIPLAAENSVYLFPDISKRRNPMEYVYWNPNTPRFLMPGGTITTHRTRKVISVAY